MINRSQDEIVQNWPQNWENPTVSIRCTTYNQEAYISQALDGFLMQETTFPFEIVVHDDASTDRTADIIREYEKKFPKIIKPIYETENQYSKRDGSLRRIMNKACIGKYVAYCEGDDFWTNNNKLQQQYEAMEAHPECSLCSHLVQVISENGQTLERTIPSKGVFDNIIDQNSFAKILLEAHKHTLQTSSYFLRNSLLQQNKLFFNYPGNGDEKILRLCLKEGNFFFIPTIMSCYRTLSKGSWTSKTIYKNKTGSIKLLQNTIKLNTLFDQYANYKFHNFIEYGNKKIQLAISIKEGKYKDLFTPQNKEIAKGFISPYKLWVYYVFSKLPHFIIKILYSLWSLIRPIIQKLTNKT